MKSLRFWGLGLGVIAMSLISCSKAAEEHHLDFRKTAMVWTDFANGQPVRVVEVQPNTETYNAQFGTRARHGPLISGQYRGFIDAIQTELPFLVNERGQSELLATIELSGEEKHWKLFLRKGDKHSETLLKKVGNELPTEDTPGAR